ncbi:hypothetical protein ACFPIJ_54275 [Dactylosporangium cerinum]|uniref:Integral membrane protein n=1 Tax=Dactylosporangium cerinum TaxID=1434730 RepID=A0ABV9WGY6_9ACTN
MWWRAASVGVVLGGLAYAADFCQGTLAVVMLLVSSSMFAWGAAGLAFGFAARDRRSAIGAAVTVLTVATLVYYGIILVDGHRWRDAVTDGDAFPGASSLVSVLTAAAFWTAASIAGGTVLGLFGQAIHRARPTVAALVAGCSFALLAGQGAVAAVHVYTLGAGWAWLVEGVAEVLLAAALTAALLGRAPGPHRWWTFAGAAVALLAASYAVSGQLDTIRTTGTLW